MFDLTSRIAMVTGGANGIGKGIAETLAQAGATVMIGDINEEAGQKAAEEINGEFYHLDVTNKDNAGQVVQDILKKHKRIDILAANAGIYPDQSIAEMEESDWDKIQNINLKGMFFTSKPVLEAMKKQNGSEWLGCLSLPGFCRTVSKSWVRHQHPVKILCWCQASYYSAPSKPSEICVTIGL
ncbi:hypothetical protein GCM10008983_07700 [Lentibacillus halophilus]|uniref:Short chain dehydrogenase n=1 Tax=Lentibacillus halophilus TaxID=295065 RepID=A0ABP3IYL7_9BACI